MTLDAGADLEAGSLTSDTCVSLQGMLRTVYTLSSPMPGDENMQCLFRNSFQIWQSENAELEQISLRFSGRAAQLVRERNWHFSAPSQ